MYNQMLIRFVVIFRFEKDSQDMDNEGGTLLSGTNSIGQRMLQRQADPHGVNTYQPGVMSSGISGALSRALIRPVTYPSASGGDQSLEPQGAKRPRMDGGLVATLPSTSGTDPAIDNNTALKKVIQCSRYMCDL